MKEEAAFPLSVGIHDDLWHSGLTKREYFAILAFQGILANTYRLGQMASKTGGTSLDVLGFEETARQAVAYADALLQELSKEAKDG